MKILIFIFIFSLIKIISSETCKYSISCAEDDSKFCSTKKRTESNSIFEIKVKPCSSMPCNIYDTLLGDTEKNTTCGELSENLKFKNPSYPGGVCDENINCLSGICISGRCVDSLLYQECHSHENCPINSACIEDMCKPYTNDGFPCKDSYQCHFDSFCNIKTNKCEKLFSYKDGDDITDLASSNERTENLCQSGGYITEKDSNGNITKKCETLTNIDNNCNDVCRYKRASNSEIFISEEKCMCGYNKYRSKFCVLGNGEKLYKEHLNDKINFIKNKTLTKFCHTLERDFDEICLELINIHKRVSFRKYVQEYNNKKILALQHHRLQESEDCIKEVLFNYDNKDIFGQRQNCPVFSCQTKKENCLYGINPQNEFGEDMIIELNPDSCHEKEYCSLPNENKIINTSLIMERTSLEGQCKIFQENTNIKRYPGEECIFNVDCLFDDSICQNGKCTGVPLGENCSETSQCLVGHYCDKISGKCEVQKEEGQKCVETWDCKNYLGCFKGKCIKLGLLKKGIKVSPDIAPFPGNDKRHLLCYTGELEQIDGISGNYCVENDYDDIWLQKYKKQIDENGFVKCLHGTKCSYINGKNKFEKDCECGYNSMGQGYCPKPSARNLEAYKEKMKFIQSYVNNECHSLSRYNCYLKNNYEFYVEQRQHEAKTTNAHLFYNSVDCAYKIFADQKYIKYSFYLIGLLFALLY